MKYLLAFRSDENHKCVGTQCFYFHCALHFNFKDYVFPFFTHDVRVALWSSVIVSVVLGVFEPITAIIVGTLMFGEPLTTNIIVGISIAMVAVTFMITVTKR